MLVDESHDTSYLDVNEMKAKTFLETTVDLL